MDSISNFVLGYLVVMTLVGFISMGIDKQRARERGWRIPERTLLLIAFIGGGIGSFLGMRFFRHKTKHGKFTWLLPIALGLYMFIFIVLINM